MFMSGYLRIFVLIGSVLSIICQCNNEMFVLVSSEKILLFDSQSTNLLFETQSNQTIESAVFHRKTNTIIFSLDNSKIYTLNPTETISSVTNLFVLSIDYLGIGQQYFYILNIQTHLLNLYSLPLTSSSSTIKQIQLTNLPINRKIFKYLIDENVQLIWILFQTDPYEIYICHLTIAQCQFYTNIINFGRSQQFSIDWSIQQIYLYSNQHLILFDYNQTHTIYSIHYLNSTKYDYFIHCQQTNSIEYLSLSNIYLIEPYSFKENLPICSKQRTISRLIIIILILIDLSLTIAWLVWLGIQYLSISIEKETITYF